MNAVALVGVPCVDENGQRSMLHPGRVQDVLGLQPGFACEVADMVQRALRVLLPMPSEQQLGTLEVSLADFVKSVAKGML